MIRLLREYGLGDLGVSLLAGRCRDFRKERRVPGGRGGRANELRPIDVMAGAENPVNVCCNATCGVHQNLAQFR